MHKQLTISPGAKILDQKTEGGLTNPPPASLRVKNVLYYFAMQNLVEV